MKLLLASYRGRFAPKWGFSDKPEKGTDDSILRVAIDIRGWPHSSVDEDRSGGITDIARKALSYFPVDWLSPAPGSWTVNGSRLKSFIAERFALELDWLKDHYVLTPEDSYLAVPDGLHLCACIELTPGMIPAASVSPDEPITSDAEMGGHTLAAGPFVDRGRIAELKAASQTHFDLSKLVRFCEELNACHAAGCYLAVAMLTRALIDHVPPVFNCGSFSEVANNYQAATKSFKELMQHLDKSSRKVADAHLHGHLRKKEVLPKRTQVNFASELDVLLAEVVRILK